MKTFGICPNLAKDKTYPHIKSVISFLQKNQAKVFIDEEAKDLYPVPVIDKNTKIDIMIALGGDGSLLYCKQKYMHMQETLFTSVNLGSLGFMADVPLDKMEAYLQDLLMGRYKSTERLVLEAKDPLGKTYFALNDFVFHRGNYRSMIRLQMHMDDLYFNTFLADGIILATPTGSTAYSLAVGGPIMDPSLEGILIAPIAVHTLTNRHYIANPKTKISLVYDSDYGPIDVIFDGLGSFSIAKGEKITFTASKKTFKTVQFTEKHTFYDTLKTKLHWSGNL